MIKVTVDKNAIQDPPKPVAFRSVGRSCLIDEPQDCVPPTQVEVHC